MTTYEARSTTSQHQRGCWGPGHALLWGMDVHNARGVTLLAPASQAVISKENDDDGTAVTRTADAIG
jgi:hypothetical protein